MAVTRMTVAEREEFLADTHVAILAVAGPDGQGPLAVPVGYVYEPGGDIRFTTGTGTRKMALARAAGRVGFVVQTEEMPVKYVSVEGPIVAEEPASAELSYAIAARHLEPEAARRYVAETAGDPETVAVRVRPEHWRTYDSAKEGAG